MMGIRSRPQVRAKPEADQEGATNPDGDVPVVTSTTWGWTKRLPPWSLMPLASAFVACLLMACMLPVYLSFKKMNAQQDTPVLFPETYTLEQLYSSEEGITLELDLIAIEPKTREAQFLLELYLGEKYEHDDHEGVPEFEEGYYLTIILGRQSIKVESGSALSDTTFTFILEDEKPLFEYPFDEYKLDMSIRAALVNPTTGVEIMIDVGLVLFEGEQGWETHSELAPYSTKDGKLVPGVSMAMSMKRSVSVQFFSMFIVILMWFISLSIFTISLNFIISPSLEISYDVPALAVGFLFALPFVRDVQPNVPTVGATIDVMGFLFNMLLISASTVMALAALSSRHHRAMRLEQQQQAERLKARLDRAAQEKEQASAEKAPQEPEVPA